MELTENEIRSLLREEMQGFKRQVISIVSEELEFKLSSGTIKQDSGFSSQDIVSLKSDLSIIKKEMFRQGEVLEEMRQMLRTIREAVTPLTNKSEGKGEDIGWVH